MKFDLHTVPRRWVFLSGLALVVWTVSYIFAAWLIREGEGAFICGFFLAVGGGAIAWSLTYASEAGGGRRGFDVLEADEVTPPPDRQ